MFPKLQRKIFIGTFAIAMFGSVLALAILASATPAGFKQAFNEYMMATAGISNGYDYIIAKAKELGFQMQGFDWRKLFLSIPLGYWTFMGYYASAHIAGEIKEPTKSLPISIIGSLLFCWIFFSINIAVFYRVVGWEFTHALGYLIYEHPEALPLKQTPYLNLLVGILAKNVIINAIIGISFFLWCVFIPIEVFVQASRYVFTWAFYRIAPEKFAAVHEKYRSPWVAIIVTGLGTWLFMILYMFTPLFKTLLKYTLMNSIIFFIIGICAILLPIRKKELFEASPEMVKKRIAGIPLIWIASAINCLLYALVIYSSFSWSFAYWSFVILVFIPGLVIYYIARAIRRRQGIDLDLAFMEIPPE